MALFKKYALGASLATLAALAPLAAVHAQATSAQLRGSVVDAGSAPVAGATVTIIHVPTGQVSVAVTNNTGSFFQSGLRVGGPYTVTVSAPGFEGEAINNLTLAPGSQAPLQLQLNAAVVERIVVRGQAINTLDLNNGVGSTYSATDIANRPNNARDVLATLSNDPLAFNTGEGQLTVAGVNPRFNALAIDGSLQQDDFGLGSNTYATARSPINLDAVEAVSLEAANYSVTVSGFTGGLVNVVTKSGSNEFDGSLFYYYQDESFIGDSAFGGDVTVDTAPFTEEEYGFTLSGSIIKDRLFFFVSYDEYENSGAGSAFESADINDGIDPAFYSTLADFVQANLGVDIGTRPATAATPETTERFLGKLDWNINEDHRASFTYQTVEESGTSVSRQNFEQAWYDIPVELTAYTGQLYSDWTPNLSTTFRINCKEFSRGQNCRAGSDQPELEFTFSGDTNENLVGTPFEGLISGGSEVFIAGCDRFRHANVFEDERLQVFGSADYSIGNHVITLGGEFEYYELFNLFVERSNGRFRYGSNNAVSFVDDILNNTPRVEYINAISNDANDAASAWGYNKFTFFIQDSWQVTPALEVNAGVRYELYQQDDAPVRDQAIEALYGRDTSANLDALDLFQPRVSFRWDATDRTTVTGGFGLFSGGDPKVWTSNAFQPPVVSVSQSGLPITGFNVPADLLNQVAAAPGASPIDIIDEDFEIPADWKASLRLDQEFDLNFRGFNLGSDYLFTAQVLYTQSKQSFLWRNVAQTENPANLPAGVAPDGRPIYADLQALGEPNLTLLTNDDGATGVTFSIALAKEYDYGLGFQLSYANQDVEYVSEGTSSRGISNWRGIAAADRNFPEVRTALFEIEHAFKLNLSYERDFFRDYTSRFDLFGQITSGEPFFYAFNVSNNNSLFGRAGNSESPFDNNPIYVPEVNDSRVVYSSGFPVADFDAFIEARGLARGGINPVNSDNGAWNQRWDFRFQQDLPGIPGAERFVGDNRLKFVFDVENVANLLNNEWGTQVNSVAFGQAPVVTADLVTAADVAAFGVDGASALTGDAARTACVSAGDCVYRYNAFTSGPANGSTNDFQSVYRIRVGIRYEF